MTILQVCAVRDVAISAFNRPIFVQSLGLACRMFEDECRRVGEDNAMARHPGDFALYHLGTYEDEDGRFENLDNPVRLMEAVQAVVSKEGG